MKVKIDFLPEFMSDDEIKVTLMSIYDKSKISNVSDEYIAFLLKEMRK